MFEAETGLPWTPAKIQALLWYFEKQVHQIDGSDQKSDAPDYGTAANEIFKATRGTDAAAFEPSDVVKRPKRGKDIHPTSRIGGLGTQLAVRGGGGRGTEILPSGAEDVGQNEGRSNTSGGSADAKGLAAEFSQGSSFAISVKGLIALDEMVVRMANRGMDGRAGYHERRLSTPLPSWLRVRTNKTPQFFETKPSMTWRPGNPGIEEIVCSGFCTPVATSGSARRANPTIIGFLRCSLVFDVAERTLSHFNFQLSTFLPLPELVRSCA